MVKKLVDKFDWFVYRVFCWRWNKKLEENDRLRKALLMFLMQYEVKKLKEEIE